MTGVLRSPKALASACGATLFLLAYRGAPSAFDEWLALPIAVETAFPGTYPKTDLLVQGSMAGPFHLYKAAGALYAMGINVDVAWYILLALSLVAFFLAVWRLAGVVGLDDNERVILVLAIAASPIYQGTLNWSAQPMLSFITASVAVPLGLLAVTAALEERLRPALLYAAIAFDIHPSIGLCTGIAVIALVPARFSLRALKTAWLPAALVGLPNIIYLLTHRPAPAAGGGAQLWAVHLSFGYHTFVRDHANGYAWYALALAVALSFSTQADGRARRAGQAAAVLSAAAIAWIAVMNLTAIPALIPLYLIRASLLVKPIVMGLALMALTRLRYPGRYSFLAPYAAVLAVAHPDPVIAEASLAIVLGIVLRPSRDRRLAAFGFAAWTAGIVLLLVVLGRRSALLDPVTESTMSLRWVATGVGLAASVMLLIAPAATGEPTRAPSGWRVWVPVVSMPALSVMLAHPMGKSWLPASAARISAQLHLSRPGPREAGVMEWASHTSAPGSLFVIPPVNANWVRFRLVARRGVYVMVHDINQLMYVPNFVLESVARLGAIGVSVKAPHVFETRPYVFPTCERLARLAHDGVDYYVLPEGGVMPAGSVTAYRDDAYSVLDVKRTVPHCGVEVR